MMSNANMSPSWWLHLDMNAYFAACEQQYREELRGRPVGIVPVISENTGFIAASYEAKCFGIKTGTRIAEARRLCPDIRIVEARPRLYRETHFAIISAVEKVAPVHEVLSVDEMVIRPWKNESQLSEALRLGQKVQDAIRYDVGEWLSCSVGFGPSPFLAKVASDLQKPRGLSVVSPEDLPNKLYGLKLTDWPGIGKRMEARFHATGVFTSEEMYQLTMPAMRRIFGGIVGERWYRLIHGERVAMPPVKRWQIGHSNVLAPEFRTRNGAWSVACRLLEKAAERLRDDGYHCCRLSVSVEGLSRSRETGEENSWTKRVKFAPTNRTLTLLPTLRSLWQDDIAKPIQVSIALQDIIPDRDVTLSLFDDPSEDRIETTVDSINRKMGRGTVTIAAALCSKDYLDHARIPFGPPHPLPSGRPE
jgi:DNA polymerase-4